MTMPGRVQLAKLLSVIFVGAFLASTARGQVIKGEEIVKYLQPGRWEIEIIPDLSRLTEAQRKKYESHGGANRMKSTDCLDAHGKSEMMQGLDASVERDAERDCKSKLTPLGAHEAKIVTTCNIRGKVSEIIATCRYTTLEVSRKEADGKETIYKKAHRVGDCK